MGRWLFFFGATFVFIEAFSLLPLRDLKPRETQVKKYPTGVFHLPLPKTSQHDGWREAARAVSHDFLVFFSKEKAEPLENPNDGPDLYLEREVDVPSGTLLVFDEGRSALPLEINTLKSRAIAHLNRSGADSDWFLALAHPNDTENPWERFDKTALALETFHWSSRLLESFQESPGGFFFNALFLGINPYLGLLRTVAPNPKEFAAWDSINSVDPGHFAFGGMTVPGGLLRGTSKVTDAPGYRSVLRGISQVVFTELPLPTDPATRKQTLYRALKAGKSAAYVHALAPYADQRWEAKCGGESGISGSTLFIGAGECAFTFELGKNFPYPAEWRLLRNGEAVHKALVGDKNRYVVDKPGVYRSEIWVYTGTRLGVFLSKPVPYLWYNPIYLK